MSDERFKKIPKGVLVLGVVVGGATLLSVLAAILGSLSSGDVERGKPILLEVPKSAPISRPLDEPAKVAASRHEASQKVATMCDVVIKEKIDKLTAEIDLGRANAWQQNAYNKAQAKGSSPYAEAIINLAAQGAMLQKQGGLEGRVPLTAKNTQILMNSLYSTRQAALALPHTGGTIPSVNIAEIKQSIDDCLISAQGHYQYNPELGKETEGVPAQLPEQPQQPQQQEQTDGDISGGGDEDGSY